MPEELALPEPWVSQGWKAKIRDREGPEEPHVTILHGTLAWRFSLRQWRYLDTEPSARLVPEEVLDFARANLARLVAGWDRMYPRNVVHSPEPPAEEAPKKPTRKRRKKK